MSIYDRSILCEEFPDLRVRIFDTVDSTNSEARRQVEAGLSAPALFISERQENGRGRHGRSFYSPQATGIYMTLYMPVHAAYDDAVRATAKTAVSVYRGISESTGLPVGIKWVNDLYLYGRKIAGILVESVLGEDRVEGLIIGIGINVTTEDFPEELRQKAGSLGVDHDRTALVISVVKALLPEISDLTDLRYLETYRAASVVLGRKVTYEGPDGPEEAEASEIDDSGALVVTKEDGTHVRLDSGEISILVEGLGR